jgi:hypothetical protein
VTRSNHQPTRVTCHRGRAQHVTAPVGARKRSYFAYPVHVNQSANCSDQIPCTSDFSPNPPSAISCTIRDVAGHDAGVHDDAATTATVEGDRDGVEGSIIAADAALLAARRYQVLTEVARGGVGRILRARDLAFNRIVAIKEPLDPARGGAHLRAEAMILALLQHPSIVPVYDSGTREDGVPFFAMKLVEGRSLQDAIGAAASLEQRLALIPQVVAVAEAVAYAHSQAIIHRDLKPANILLGRFGETIVIDWGLAKVLDRASITVAGDGGAQPARRPVTSATMLGDVMGTPAYMSALHACCERVDSSVYF